MLESIKSLLDTIASGQMAESKEEFTSIISEKLKYKLDDKRKSAMQSDCELAEDEETDQDTIDEISSTVANNVYQKRSKQLAKLHYSSTDRDSPEYKSLESKQQKAAKLYTKKVLSKSKPEAKSKEETDLDIQKKGSESGGNY